jgi:hypothetical protein
VDLGVAAGPVEINRKCRFNVATRPKLGFQTAIEIASQIAAAVQTEMTALSQQLAATQARWHAEN